MAETIILSTESRACLISTNKEGSLLYNIYNNDALVASLVIENNTVVYCYGKTTKDAPARIHIPLIQQVVRIKKFDVDGKVPYVCLVKQGNKYYDVFNLPANFIVEGSINLSGLGLYTLPNMSTVIVKGDFDCSNNNLSLLKGAPRNVYGNFTCAHNMLMNLQYSPRYVSGNYDCHHNRLNSLQGSPNVIGGGFNCSYNSLSNLTYGPMLCGSNDKLREQHLDVDCSNNCLVSLCGLPTIRKEDMNLILSNNSLTKESPFPQWIVSDLDRVKGVSSVILGYWQFLVDYARKTHAYIPYNVKSR